jgi:hypothetical protein
VDDLFLKSYFCEIHNIFQFLLKLSESSDWLWCPRAQQLVSAAKYDSDHCDRNLEKCQQPNEQNFRQ